MRGYFTKAAATLAVSLSFSILSGSFVAQAGVGFAAQGAFTPMAQAANSAAPAVPAQANFNPATSDQLAKTATTAAGLYETKKLYTGERISLEFQNVDLHHITNAISQTAGKNIVVPDDVNSKISLKLTNLPWDQALDIILASRNLGLKTAGNDLIVHSLPGPHPTYYSEKSRAAARDSQVHKFVKKVFSPKYSPIDQVTEELKKIRSGAGRMVVIGNEIYVEDEPDNVIIMAQAFIRIDKEQ